MKICISIIITLIFIVLAEAAVNFKGGQISSSSGNLKTEKPAKRPDLIFTMSDFDSSHLNLKLSKFDAIRFERRIGINVIIKVDDLFKLKEIPVVNENDSTATSEIKYGDNDRLAARVAQIIGADMLILFSDVDGLYDKSKGKKIVREVTSINEKIMSLIDNKKNKFGSGGITTKLDAAKICMNSGSHMFIANGKVNNPIANMIKNKKYTHFLPKISTLDARKKWIIGSLNYNGTIYIDNGAAKALSNGKSLLAAGITKINGNFKKGENVIILDQNNNQLARGLSSFSSTEIDKIKGKQSKEIETILGYLSKTEVIHKDDMVLL